MRAKRVYNNNVVLAEKNNGDEIILVGKGIAYGMGRGDKVEKSKIEKKFELKEKINSKFKELIQDVPLDYILISEEMIAYIKKHSNKQIDDSIYVTLTDHVVNMVDRIQKGVNFDTLLLLNVKSLYQEEYKLALNTLEILRKQTDLKIDDSEANFIALHIINAETDLNMMQMYTILAIIDEIINIVDKNFVIDKNNLSFDRFITHCRFFAQRITNKEYFDNNLLDNDRLFKDMKTVYLKQYECIHDISQFIEKKYRYVVTENEKIYLLVHLIRLIG